MKLIDEIGIKYANANGGGLPLTAKEYCNALALWVQKHISEDKELTVNTLYELLAGTDTITLNNNGQKIEIHLNAEVLLDIEKSLKFPVSNPNEIEMVGVDSTGQQIMIPISELGDGAAYKHNIMIYLQSEKIYNFVVYSSKSTALTLQELKGSWKGVGVIVQDGVDYTLSTAQLLSIDVRYEDFYGQQKEYVTMETINTTESLDQEFISTFTDSVDQI